MAFRECWCQNWGTLSASNIFINRFSHVDWLHLWCLPAGIPFIPKLQVSTKPWLDVDIYLYLLAYSNCAKTLKHKGNRFLYINVNMCSTVPCSKPDHNSTQLHLLTQNYCTLQLFSSCSYTLQPNTEMKELKFARWCMTSWILLTLTCSSHCHTF